MFWKLSSGENLCLLFSCYSVVGLQSLTVITRRKPNILGAVDASSQRVGGHSNKHNYYLLSSICYLCLCVKFSSLFPLTADELTASCLTIWRLTVFLFKQHKALLTVLFLMACIFMTWKNVQVWQWMDPQDVFGQLVPSEWTMIRKTDVWFHFLRHYLNKSPHLSVWSVEGLIHH